MTCIIGYKYDGDVWLGADSRGADPDYGSYGAIAFEKIFRLGDVLMGFCGSFRAAQLLGLTLEVPEHPEDVEDNIYLAQHFIPAVRKTLRKGRAAYREGGVDEGCQFLLAYSGELYQVQGDFSFLTSRRSYEAIGSGGEIALGAMEILKDYDLSPKKMIRQALKASAEHNAFVGGPYVVRKL